MHFRDFRDCFSGRNFTLSSGEAVLTLWLLACGTLAANVLFAAESLVGISGTVCFLIIDLDCALVGSDVAQQACSQGLTDRSTCCFGLCFLGFFEIS